jgi:adenylate cyclase
VERRLTAILAADVVGYSRLMGEDEVGTLARLRVCRKDLVDPAIAEFHGHTIKLMGDGTLVEFASIVDAVQCAAAIQRRMADCDQRVAEARRIRLRIGVNLGDVLIEDNDIYGDGVNIAARLESLAEPGGICISGTAFDHIVGKVDVGFAALGEQKLKNIAAPIRVYRVLLDASQAGKVTPAKRRLRPLLVILAGAAMAVILLAAFLFAWQKPALPPRPSVVVLPFENQSGDASQDYFADGITEDLITDLAKLNGLDVIARDSAFAYKGIPIIPADVARDLGVRYVVEGTVRRADERTRINVELIDTSNGKHIWADRFDRPEADVFTLQDEMRQEIAKALNVEPLAAETEQIERPPTANLEAYDYFLRAEQASRTGTPRGLREALGFYDLAEALDPNFAEVFAADARTASFIWRMTYDDVLQSALARKRAYDAAGRALQLDPGLALPYATLAILQSVDRRFDESIVSAQKAVALGPGNADAYITLGYVHMFAGSFPEAAVAIETALKLDPKLSPVNRQIAGAVFFFGGDNDRAIEILELAREEAPELDGVLITLAAAYARGGRLDDARAAIEQSIRLPSSDPSFAAIRMGGWAHFRNEKDLAFLSDALRHAGLPEWPFGFQETGRERLKGDEIMPLVFDHTLRGVMDPGKRPAIMQVGTNGKAAFRTTASFVTAMMFIQNDLLCTQSENAFGQPDCGPVLKTGEELPFVYVNSGFVFYFRPES